MTRRRAAALAVLVFLAALGPMAVGYQLTAVQKDPKPTSVMPESPPEEWDPDNDYAPILPPAWALGDRWLIEIATLNSNHIQYDWDDAGGQLGVRKSFPMGRELTMYELHVIEVHQGDSPGYQVEVTDLTNSGGHDGQRISRWGLYFGKKPFALVGRNGLGFPASGDRPKFPDQSGPVLMQPMQMDDRPRLLVLFPGTPEPPWAGPAVWHARIPREDVTQTMVREGDVLRIETLGATMIWRRGDPWYESAEYPDPVPTPEDPDPYPAYGFSIRLLR